MSDSKADVNDPRARLWSRRDVIIRVSAMLGGSALVGQAAMLAGCERKEQQALGEAEPGTGLFSAADVELLTEIADTILPATDTPGARAAGVGPFIALMVVDTYDDDEQRIFTDGLATLNDDCRETYGADFLSVTAGQRLEFVEALDRAQFEAQQRGKPVHYFRMLKELTLLGYFTSEIGYTQAMRYTETPGRYDPCTPLEPGDTTWAPHA